MKDCREVEAPAVSQPNSGPGLVAPRSSGPRRPWLRCAGRTTLQGAARTTARPPKWRIAPIRYRFDGYGMAIRGDFARWLPARVVVAPPRGRRTGCRLGPCVPRAGTRRSRCDHPRLSAREASLADHHPPRRNPLSSRRNRRPLASAPVRNNFPPRRSPSVGRARPAVLSTSIRLLRKLFCGYNYGLCRYTTTNRYHPLQQRQVRKTNG